ncbi:CLUMA_CG018894, isoform A [Clunio marinus]|uniref:CLUMA_CG018894, isoform A n=1 Tax=Clunio marinus TaxID=568069 RepID=A0A1J1J0K2_9DIPT|nr:CLUMA_CG018894, isoform A [Clunio marinus]
MPKLKTVIVASFFLIFFIINGESNAKALDNVSGLPSDQVRGIQAFMTEEDRKNQPVHKRNHKRKEHIGGKGLGQRQKHKKKHNGHHRT